MPSPLATDQRISPLFKSIATRREYGGLNGSGRPCGPNGHGTCCFTYGSVDSACSDLPSATTVSISQQHRRRVERSRLVLADDLLRFGLELWREVDEIVLGHTLLIERRRL